MSLDETNLAIRIRVIETEQQMIQISWVFVEKGSQNGINLSVYV